MNLWRLTPAADDSDPRWRGETPLAGILVAAHTPGEARVVASRALVGGEKGGVANEIGPPHTAVNDEKLYRLVRVAPDGEALPETPQVLKIER